MTFIFCDEPNQIRIISLPYRTGSLRGRIKSFVVDLCGLAEKDLEIAVNINDMEAWAILGSAGKREKEIFDPLSTRINIIFLSKVHTVT